MRDRLADSRCLNDCHGDRAVTAEELLRAVSISLSDQGVEACSVADANGDGELGIEALVRGVKAALMDCEV